jgi:FkbH-like protein
MERDHEQAHFSGNYDEFLLSCEMKLEIFVPHTDSDVLRVFELLQRSNQLNISTRRYSMEQLKEKIADPEILPLAISAKDRFGDYGIIAVSTIELGGAVPVMVDFAMSCRASQKKVEHAFFAHVSSALLDHGSSTILVALTKTERNKPIQSFIEGLKSSCINVTGETSHHEFSLSRLDLPVLMTVRMDDSIRNRLSQFRQGRN